MIWEAQELVARSKLSSFTRWLRILASWKPNITGYIIDGVGAIGKCSGRRIQIGRWPVEGLPADGSGICAALFVPASKL